MRLFEDILVCFILAWHSAKFPLMKFISVLLFAANFSQDEIGEPILDVTLSAGDMLYFPRGTIHQVRYRISVTAIVLDTVLL